MTGFDDDLNACAALVEKGDPDRFRATMAAPVAARQVLFPLYAFNIEVARAPWVTQEPLIAEMRLQWWADALDEIAGGGVVRRHEVVTPLAHVLDAAGAAVLQRVVDARRRDARRDPVGDVDSLRAYLRDTGGALIWAAVRALGAGDEARALAVGEAQALANYLLAVPAFLARGVNPLPEMTEDQFARLLTDALAALRRAGRAPDRAQRIAELAVWRASGVLKRALRDPAAVAEGRLAGPEAARRLSLMLAALRV